MIGFLVYDLPGDTTSELEQEKRQKKRKRRSAPSRRGSARFRDGATGGARSRTSAVSEACNLKSSQGKVARARAARVTQGARVKGERKKRGDAREENEP